MSAKPEIVYGDPCRECGFEWSTPIDDLVAVVETFPQSFTDALAGTDGTSRHPDLTWSAKAYVLHVADNLRIFAERLSGVLNGAASQVVAYDENDLAAARRYESLPVEAALWSIGTSMRDWTDAVRRAQAAGIVLHHPERGTLRIDAIIRANAHDGLHHLWDVQRSVG